MYQQQATWPSFVCKGSTKSECFQGESRRFSYGWTGQAASGEELAEACSLAALAAGGQAAKLSDEDRGWDKEGSAELYMHAVLDETLQACFDVVLDLSFKSKFANCCVWLCDRGIKKFCIVGAEGVWKGRLGIGVCLREKLLLVMEFEIESNKT